MKRLKAMDSGNSGSMQSSSGGDEEYDSRTESISPFLNPPLSFGSISNHPQPPPQPPPPLCHQQTFPPTLFDPQAHTLGAFSHSPPNLDLVWSRELGSDPNYTDLGNFTSLSSLSSSLTLSSQSLLGVQFPNQGPFPTSSSSMPLPSGSDQTNVVVKNSRKRTRASRRVPTTVLTTDTSNFRQMVQEFTGIPAPPFSASPYSRRLDLFGGGSSLRSGHLETLGPLYPFRPSAQKLQVQPSPFVSSSSAIDAIATHDASSTNPTLTTSMSGPSNTFSTSSSYQLAPDLSLLPKQPQLMLNIQNPILTFQSLLQPPLKYPLTRPSLDELGLTREHVINADLSTTLPSTHGSSEGVRGRSDNNLSRWRGDQEPANDGGHQEHLGTFDGNNGDSKKVSSGYKLNCSASTSDFFPEKSLENVSSRNEGTVESWLCPSD